MDLKDMKCDHLRTGAIDRFNAREEPEFEITKRSVTFCSQGIQFDKKKDKGKIIVYEDGSKSKIKKVANETTVKVKRYVPWVKWFWKIKVPRWMMYKISFDIKNRWTRYKTEPGYFFIIWLGCELSHGGEYGKYPGAHHFDVTVLNFGLTINLYPPGPRPWGINAL